MTLRAGFLCAALLCTAPLVAQSQGVTAILEPAESVDIRTNITGQLLSVDVDEGTPVTQGATLAQIESRTQQKRVDLAQAVAEADGRLQRAAAQIAQARALLERLQTAKARGAAQSWEVEQAEQSVALAEADLQIARDGQLQAKAQMALEQAILDEYTLRAPFAGVVLDVLETPGAQVNAQSVILSLAQLEALEATAFIPLEWLERIAVGQSLAAEIDGAGLQSAAVEITTIDPRIDPASRTVRIRVALDNADGAFQPGATLIIQAP